ncbi:hypothetical protein KBD87_00985 [Candidatus Saccharibacteria bacterium]|jgi:hypothetical protein|nr:hypothetical protein [Candidatus Saccharibacteria bacterium]
MHVLEEGKHVVVYDKIDMSVMQRMYLQKHPELQTKHPESSHSAARIIIALLLFFLVFVPFLQLIVSMST